MSNHEVTSPFRFRDPRPVRWDECGICGTDMKPALAHHNSVVHDVWAYETYGMHAVTFPNRDRVQGWAGGSIPLPE